MGEAPPRGQLDQLRRDMQDTTTKLADVVYQLRDTLRQQQHVEEDMRETRAAVQSIHQLLQGGDLPLLTRMIVVEGKVKEVEASQFRNRDWWLKIAATLTTALIVAMAGLLLVLYVSTKTPLPKP
jgi:hypothetical protein